MVRSTHRYTQDRSDERVRNFRKGLRMGNHEAQSTSDEREIPSSRSIDFGWCRAIAALEILGGGTGLAVGSLFPLLNSSFSLSPAAVALNILFLLSIIAGVYLWRNHAFGFNLSVFLFLLQIPQFVLGGISFQFISGISITPMIYSTSRGMGVELAPFMGPGGEFAIQSAFNPDLIFSIGINIYAVILAFILIKHMVKDEEQKLGEAIAESRRLLGR